MSADSLEVIIVINGTLTGASWVDAGGVCESDVSSTVITGGTQVLGSYIKGSSSSPSLFSERSLFESTNLFLGRSILGVSDIVTVCVRSFSGNADASASITYREL